MTYVIGGYDRGTLGSVLAFNFTSMAWTEMASLKEPRHRHACTYFKGKIYVTGNIASSFNIFVLQKEEKIKSTI